MGYKHKRKVYNLTFEDYEGLKIATQSMSLGDYISFTKMLDTDGLTDDNVDEVFDSFVKVIVSWNIEDDAGQPIPVSKKALYELDLELVREIIDGWRQGVEGVSVPLEPSSDSGQPSLAASIPMEGLSASHAS